MPPSQANPKANLPPAADRAILKALEKSKDNRHADVTAMAAALQEVIDQAREQSSPNMVALSARLSAGASMDVLETRKGDNPYLVPPAMPAPAPLDVRVASPLPMAPPHHAPTPGFGAPQVPQPYPMGAMMAPAPLTYPQAPAGYAPVQQRASSPTKWVWWIVGLLALGAAAGAILALAMRYF
jgi:hypothetical protein